MTLWVESDRPGELRGDPLVPKILCGHCDSVIPASNLQSLTGQSQSRLRLVAAVRHGAVASPVPGALERRGTV